MLTYADGTTSTVTQSLSDWLAPENYAGESIALNMPYRLTATGAKSTVATDLYVHAFAIDASKTLVSLTLPKNPNLMVLAVELLPAP